MATKSIRVTQHRVLARWVGRWTRHCLQWPQPSERAEHVGAAERSREYQVDSVKQEVGFEFRWRWGAGSSVSPINVVPSTCASGEYEAVEVVWNRSIHNEVDVVERCATYFQMSAERWL